MKYSPMLCKLIKEPFKDKAWVFECKIDGIRIIAIKNGAKVKLLTRNNKDKAKQFPEIVAAIKKLKPKKIVMDGELAAYRKDLSSFQELQPRIGQTNPEVIAELVKTNPVSYLIFDLLNLEGKNWETKPLLERKKKLQHLIQGTSKYTPTSPNPSSGRRGIISIPPLDKGRLGGVVYLNHTVNDGVALFRKAKQKHWEGIVGKKIDSRYHEGKRGSDWVKIKTHNQQEFVIGAYTPGQGKTKSTFGAVLVGYYRAGKLIYAGKVGTGFTDAERRDLKQKFLQLESTRSPFTAISKNSSSAQEEYVAASSSVRGGHTLNSSPAGGEDRRGGSIFPERRSNLPAGRQGVTLDENIIWLKPKLVGEFSFGEWTKDNILRQPVYMGLRTDKAPKSVIKEN